MPAGERLIMPSIQEEKVTERPPSRGWEKKPNAGRAT